MAASKAACAPYLSGRTTWATATAPRTNLPTHIGIKAGTGGLTRDSVVLLEQVRTLDKRRLRERAGQIDPDVQRRVDEALEISFGLETF